MVRHIDKLSMNRLTTGASSYAYNHEKDAWGHAPLPAYRGETDDRVDRPYLRTKVFFATRLCPSKLEERRREACAVADAAEIDKGNSASALVATTKDWI